MALLTKAAILAAEDRRYETVQVPEWGGEVRVGSMTGLQRDRWEAAVLRYRSDGGDLNESVRALVVASCVVDEDGKPLFSLEDVASLGQKDARPLNRVFEVASKLNALTREAAEELRGN